MRPLESSGAVRKGFWTDLGQPGNPNWCELDYAFTFYVAEFFNTLSSVPLIILGLAGMFHALGQGLERRFVVCYASIATVGVGSCAFHGTLLYVGQVMDEVRTSASVFCSYHCFLFTSFACAAASWCLFFRRRRLLPLPFFCRLPPSRDSAGGEIEGGGGDSCERWKRQRRRRARR